MLHEVMMDPDGFCSSILSLAIIRLSYTEPIATLWKPLSRHLCLSVE